MLLDDRMFLARWEVRITTPNADCSLDCVSKDKNWVEPTTAEITGN